jgi:hypothetical protein
MATSGTLGSGAVPPSSDLIPIPGRTNADILLPCVGCIYKMTESVRTECIFFATEGAEPSRACSECEIDGIECEDVCCHLAVNLFFLSQIFFFSGYNSFWSDAARLILLFSLSIPAGSAELRCDGDCNMSISA